MLTLTLVRHGQTTFNAEGRLQGYCDSPLTAAGLVDVRATAAHLAEHDFTAAYVSPSGRARSTAAELLVPHPTVRPFVDSRLREFGFGVFEAQPEVDLYSRHDPDVMFPAVLDGTFPGLPAGETGRAFLARVRAVFARIERRHRDGHVLVVSHGLTLRAYLTAIDAVPMPPLGNASVSVVEVDGDHRRVVARGHSPRILTTASMAGAPRTTVAAV